MTSYECMENIIEEWFADTSINGVEGIAKTYATIIKSAELQLNFFNEKFERRGDKSMEQEG